MAPKAQKLRFAVCLEDRDCDDLERGKVYQVLLDAEAEEEGYWRILDESGEDYLYPESYFVLVDLPPKAKEVLSLSSR